MTKLRALRLLHHMKKTGIAAVVLNEELFTAEDLISTIQGREVSYEEAEKFLLA